MNIAFYLPRGIYGGGERILLTLMDEFHKNGHRVFVYSSNPQIDRSSIKYKLEVFDGIKLFQIIPIVRSFKRNNIDLLIVFGRMNQFLFASKIANVKILYSLRIDPQQCSWKKPNDRWMIKYADGRVFQTERVKNFFEKKISDRSTVIFNPIMDKLPEPSVDREKKIAIVGRLSDEKNQRLAIDAFSLVDRQGFTLHIYGQGPLENELKELVRNRKLQNVVFFEGQVKNIVEHIKHCEILILSSDFEGMPNALIEGMAMGLACISTNFPSGAAEELVADGVNGFIVPVNDMVAMSKKIELLINDPTLRTRIQVNAIKIREKLNKKKIIAQWLDYIEQIVKCK